MLKCFLKLVFYLIILFIILLLSGVYILRWGVADGVMQYSISPKSRFTANFSISSTHETDRVGYYKGYLWIKDNKSVLPVINRTSTALFWGVCNKAPIIEWSSEKQLNFTCTLKAEVEVNCLKKSVDNDISINYKLYHEVSGERMECDKDLKPIK